MSTVSTPSRPPLAIFYDGHCALCTANATKWKRTVEPRGFLFVPMQSERAVRALHLNEGKIPDEMKVETRDGRILGGVDGILFVARHIWWAWPLAVAASLPGINAVLKWRYRKIAATRYCRDGQACQIPQAQSRPL